MAVRLHVVWRGDFAGSGSIALVNRELAGRLASSVDLSLTPTDGRVAGPSLAHLVARPLPRVDLVIQHSSSPDTTPPPQGRWLWMTPWEYGASFPIDWVSAVLDAGASICVYSDWTRTHVVDSGIPGDRVFVVPLGVDTGRFDPAVRARPLHTDKACRFLFIGRLAHRKGLDIVVRAYRQAFSGRDDVALVVKPFGARGVDMAAAIGNITRPFADTGAPAIVMLPPDVAVGELAAMYTACNAFVHAYRGESFCLPMAEAMACGVPVIATDRGGASGYATPHTANLLPSFVAHAPRLSFGRRRLSNFPHWQEVRSTALADAMRSFHGNPGPARALAAAARALVAARFTWDRAADAMRRAMDACLASPAHAPAAVVRLEQRQAWLDAADAHLATGDLDAAAEAYHRCLGRRALLADRAAGRQLSARALDGLGEISQARSRPHEAAGFFRLASRLYRAGARAEIQRALS